MMSDPGHPSGTALQDNPQPDLGGGHKHTAYPPAEATEYPSCSAGQGLTGVLQPFLSHDSRSATPTRLSTTVFTPTYAFIYISDSPAGLFWVGSTPGSEQPRSPRGSEDQQLLACVHLMRFAQQPCRQAPAPPPAVLPEGPGPRPPMLQEHAP